VVDLDRQVRPQAGRAGHPPLRERGRRLAVHHEFAKLGRSPATDPYLHRLPADAEGIGERA
jgi:hypothetical protein